VAVVCAVLGVSRYGYYDWLERSESVDSLEGKRLGENVVETHAHSCKIFGARCIQQAVIEQGEVRARIRCLMKLQSVEEKSSSKATTNSNHNRPVAPNLLNRELQVAKPSTVYVGGISYIATGEEWPYVAVLVDIYFRPIVGRTMSGRGNAKLATDALNMSSWEHGSGNGLVVHRNQGSQYVSELYQQAPKVYCFVCRMSCWGNASVESFFQHCEDRVSSSPYRRYQARAKANQGSFGYIDVFYIRQRCHWTIDYQTLVGYVEQKRNVMCFFIRNKPARSGGDVFFVKRKVARYAA